MSRLIRRSKELFLLGLFALALVAAMFSTPSAAATTVADTLPTPTPTEPPSGWSDPVGG